jgi:hypothetical protein
MPAGETEVEHVSFHQTARYAFDFLSKRETRADTVPFTVVVISLEYVTERRALPIQVCDIQGVRSAVRLEIFFGAKDPHVHNVGWIATVPYPSATDPTFVENSLDLAKE